MSGNKPKVSVIIPTYNRSKLVKEAIECVLGQSYSDFEVVVVDDGSTDDTRSVIEQIPDKRVRYYYKENGGHASARNFGLLNARGEYVAYLDSDDLWPGEYIATLMKHMDENKDYGLAYARIVVLGSDGSRTEVSSVERLKSGWLTEDFFDASPCILPSAAFLRAAVCKDVFWDEALNKGYEDHDFFLRLSMKAKFLFVPDTYMIKRHYEYRFDDVTNRDSLINAARSLERFYFHLGGDKYVTEKVARRKISHRYRKAAKSYLALQNRRAALLLTKRAISCYPLDLRLYADLLRALFLSKKNDKLPDWEMPEPLPPGITVTRKS